MRKGVASIDSTMAEGWGSSAPLHQPMHPASTAAQSQTRPPAPEQTERSATPVVAPISRASTRNDDRLDQQRHRQHSTSAQRSTRMCQSSIMPMVMKNSPSSTSWKGRTTPTWWRSVSHQHTGNERARPGPPVHRARPRVIGTQVQLFALAGGPTIGRPPAHEALPAREQQPNRTESLDVMPSPVRAATARRRAQGWNQISSGTNGPNPGTAECPSPCSRAFQLSTLGHQLTTMAVPLMASTPDSASAVCHYVPDAAHPNTTRPRRPRSPRPWSAAPASAPGQNTCCAWPAAWAG